MSKFSFIRTFTTLCCLSLHCCFGLVLDIKVTPNEVDRYVHDTAAIVCNVDNSDDDISKIVTLELSKDGRHLAGITEGGSLSVAEGMDSRLKVEGKLSSNEASESYVNLTLTDPDPSDAGPYTCRLYYSSEDGVLKEAKNTANLLVSELFWKSMSKLLLDKIAKLQADHERSLKQLTSRLDIQRQTETKLNQDKISKLTSRIQTLETEVTSLNTKERNTEGQISKWQETSTNQYKQMEDFISSAKKNVHFVALHNRKGQFKKGDTLIFSEVLSNEGSGYKGVTGIFTAPVAGFYLFDISINADDGQYIYLDLRSGKGQVLSRMLAGEHTGWEQYSSMSCVVRLDAGEQVMPVIRETEDGLKLHGLDPQDYMTKFYGYLLLKAM